MNAPDDPAASQARAAGKVAFVTGAGSGIGRAAVLALAREGAAAIMATDRDLATAEQTCELVPGVTAKVVARELDVAESAAVDRAVTETVDLFGGLDLAVNNAGVSGPFKPIGQASDEDYLRVTRIDLDGVFYCLRAQINAMLDRGGGAIVNVASGGALNPKLGQSAYSAAKAGVVMLTRVAAGEYVTHGIRVNAVLPGAVVTGMTEHFLTTPGADAIVKAASPMGRMGDPAEIADAILWLCSPGASYVTGSSVLVDGGYHAFR